MRNSERQTGFCKFWKESNGYGFLTPSDGGSDVFCHFRNIQTNGAQVLHEGQEVDFEIGPGRDGKLEAFNVIPGKRTNLRFGKGSGAPFRQHGGSPYRDR